MLLNNQFKFFNKEGNNINPDVRPNLVVSIVDPTGSGANAEARAITSVDGKISEIEILNGGVNYSADTYFEFIDLTVQNNVWSTDPSSVVIADGVITGFNLDEDNLNNNDFPYPASYVFDNYFLPVVSAGLIESENIFIVERVYDQTNGNITYAYPSCDNYGSYDFSKISSNGVSATVTINKFTSSNAVINIDQLDVINVNSALANNLSIGMTVSGVGVDVDTFILDINPALGKLALTKPIKVYGSGLTFNFHVPHYLKVGSTVIIQGANLAGAHTVTNVTDFTFNFDSNVILAEVSGEFEYYVKPKFEARVKSGSDAEWFLYTVTYNEDYPTITKSQILDVEFLVPTPGVGTNENQWTRHLYANEIEKKPLQINYGVQSDVGGVYVGVIEIVDVTFTYSDQIIYSSIVECEVEPEDERLGLLLENIGADINQEEELILRDSDINEDNTNYILLNQKRKEMLLQAEQIWPYVGSYKGLVNIINWFGYYDIRIKEYFLNVNTEDVYYNKYRQVQIPFQLAEKGIQPESINLVPSNYYRKTNLFGLFYDIVKDSGEYDEFGIPATEDAFAFTNEEVLIKLFALKNFLKQKFLPLNTRIIDIAGEGVYYERYAVNTWNDRNERLLIQVGRNVDFNYDKRAQIIDIREYDANGGMLSPQITSSLDSVSTKYNIDNVFVGNNSNSFTGTIPRVIFTGDAAIQPASGEARVKGVSGQTGGYTGATNPGLANGDRVVLSGGNYERPITLSISNTGTSTFTVLDTGSNYRNLPNEFGAANILRHSGGITGNWNTLSNNDFNYSSFSVNKNNLQFQIEDIFVYELGKGYSSSPEILFQTEDATVNAQGITLEITEVPSVPSGYFADRTNINKYGDAPNIPVGAIANVSIDFIVTWDELVFTWDSFIGGDDAYIKPWLVSNDGYGTLVAAEIINPGSEYTFAPTFTAIGGTSPGSEAEIEGSLRNGSLFIANYELVLESGTESGVNVFRLLDENGVEVDDIANNTIIKGEDIEDGIVIKNTTLGINYYKLYNLIDAEYMSPAAYDAKIFKVHRGITVTYVGSNYTSEPLIAVNGGRTKTAYTWTDIGKGDFYQMEWTAKLTQPENPEFTFETGSGILPINSLLNYQFVLPYTGLYTVEMSLYDTNNNRSSAIKKDAVEVYMPSADFAYVSKNIDGCKNKWSEFSQIFSDKSRNDFSLSLTAAPDQPDPISYSWDNAVGRWINITFNQTLWNDCDVNWDTLQVTDASDVNYPVFPETSFADLKQVSPLDVYEGPIIRYNAASKIITVSGQKTQPRINPAYDQNDWIFIRRNGVIYQLEVSSANYDVAGETQITLDAASSLPTAFEQSPLNWEVLREIGGTVVVSGNYIYNQDFNLKGFKTNEYLVLNKPDDGIISVRNPIASADSESISINTALPYMGKQGVMGKIYQVRGKNVNLYLQRSSGLLNAQLVVKSDNTAELLIQSNLGFDPTVEIIPGFSIVKIKHEDAAGNIVWEQSFIAKHVNLIQGTYEGYVNPYVIDAIAIDGRTIPKLNDFINNGEPTVYLEYEYNVFATRTRYAAFASGVTKIDMDFNNFPAIPEFVAANYYYDHGISNNEYSLQVLNTGTWKDGEGTIITLDDSNNELYRIDSLFTASQMTFDEDYAKEHIGTQAQNWQNYREIDWNQFCGNSWNTLDFTEPIWSNFNFKLGAGVGTGTIKFNEYEPFELVATSGTATLKFAQAVQELNKSSKPGISKFYYEPISNLEQGIESANFNLNTFVDPNKLYLNDGNIEVNDVLYGPIFNDAVLVDDVTGGTATLNADIPKKGYFTANCAVKNNDTRILTDVRGLLEFDLAVGDYVSDTSCNKVLEVVVVNGKIRQIYLEDAVGAAGVDKGYIIEWVSDARNLPLTIPIIKQNNINADLSITALAKNPSVDNLGYLGTTGSYITFKNPRDSQYIDKGHTYSLNNFYSWFSDNEVGAFENGIQEFLTRYRFAQAYINLGTVNNQGLTGGWYPADKLPREYSYTDSNLFTNYLDAKAQAQRLPYEHAIGGSYVWEETRIGKYSGKIPVGSAVLFTADASNIAGKTICQWKLTDNRENLVLVESIGSRLLWTFDYVGSFDIELTITDSNGNTKKETKNSFITIF
jgi:hypothetical protein